MSRRVAWLSLFFAAWPIAAATAQSETEWDQGYDGVRALMVASKWKEARAALETLLKTHENKPYAIADRQSIVADHQQCVFWSEVQVPTPETLITGKIEKLDKGSRQIRLRYDPDTMSDWREIRDDLVLHPLVFAGNYTVTISGPEYPEGSLGFFWDLGGQGYFRADLGFDTDKPRVRRFDGDKETVLEPKESLPFDAGKPYRAKLEVGKTHVVVTCNDKQMWKLPRESREGVYMGITVGNYADIVLEGQMEPSWFQNLVDDELNRLREEFVDGYDKEKALPAWLFAEMTADKVPMRHDFTKERALTPDAEEVFSLIEGGAFADALEKADKLTDKDFAAADLAYVRALLLQRSGDAEKALPLIEQAMATLGEHTYARVLMAEVLTDLRRVGEALPLLQKAHTDDPGSDDALQSLFVALLRRSDVRGAERLVRAAKTQHGMWTEVFDLDRMLAMRRRGPTWPRQFVATSAHYEVRSDIDKAVCDDAIKVLEEGYASLGAEFAITDASAAAAATEKFTVYLFSGESGYQEYNSQILGQAVPHSAGLYSPVLKQLLIWNVPKRDDMVRTVRHEGFHQFLDRVMIDPPVWLNEGMAEFWETAQPEKGKRLVGGQPRPAHVATLIRSKKAIPKAKDFVYGSRADFYRNAQQRYAQGWAMVHFLRRGPASNQKIFKTLFDTLRAGEGTSKQALDKAFAGVDWDKFDGEFWTYIDKMKQK